jgi:ubiquinone/menaquinone biosynthesis C-methylase UbiE
MNLPTRKCDDPEIEIQRRYYRETANDYDRMHVCENDEHYFGLAFLVSALDYIQAKSVLDIGSGTGRALAYIKQRRLDVHLVGIEPVKELRDVGHANGLSNGELIDGDATHLQFHDQQFDLVCEFGMLHHVRKPKVVVAEMLRVARKAIFISDCNNFGQGSFLVRSFKQFLNSLGLWKVADFIKTKGRGYSLSEADGLAYSYSVYNNYKQIEMCCKSIHVFNTTFGGINPYRTAGHVALLAVK